MNKAPDITFRSAVADDVALVFRWANDPITRAVSFQSDPIPYEDHVAWFQASLKRPDRHLLLATSDNKEVAVLRFDHGDAPGVAVISINVGPDARGAGIGTATLQGATFEAARLGFDRLVAWIRPENTASVRAFVKAGYEAVGEGSVSGQPALRYERSAGQMA